MALYKVVRALPDGQRVPVGTFDDVKDARKIVERLSEYWPGDYRILQPDSQGGELGCKRFAPRKAGSDLTPALEAILAGQTYFH